MSSGDNEKLQAFRDAFAKTTRLRQQVVDWMEAEGNLGHFRINRDAPMWYDYLDAVEASDKLVTELALGKEETASSTVDRGY